MAWGALATILQLLLVSSMAHVPSSMYIFVPPLIMGSSLTLVSPALPNLMSPLNLVGCERAVACGDGRVVGSHCSQYRRPLDRSNTVLDVIQNLVGTGVDPNGRPVRRMTTCWTDFW